MTKKDKTTEYLESLKGLRLSESSRTRIERELSEYADFHTTDIDAVRVVEDGRSTERATNVSIWHTLLGTRSKRTTMPFIALAAVLIIGGGTSFAAENSLPGDVLYPVKVGVNENIKTALAVSAESEARVQSNRLEERVAEAAELKAEGRLEGELALMVEKAITEQAKEAEKASNEAEATVEVETGNQIRLSLSRFASLINSESGLAVNSESEMNSGARIAMEEEEGAASDGNASVSAESNTAVSSMLALEPIDIDTLYTNTSARIDSLEELVARYQTEISAEMHAEFTATLEEAAELLVRVDSGVSEEEARKLLTEASDIAGEVESTLSLQGAITIDPETGAIIKIDFSNPPATEPDRGGSVEPMPLPLPLDVRGEETLEGEIESSVESSLKSTSGISL